MKKNMRLVPSNQQDYYDHVTDDWNNVTNKGRFMMSQPNENIQTPKPDVIPPSQTTPSVEQPAPPLPVKLKTLATRDPQSAWIYRSDGMSCGNCANVVSDTTIEFCPHCGVGYVTCVFTGVTL